jgi:hypothetical protein
MKVYAVSEGPYKLDFLGEVPTLSAALALDPRRPGILLPIRRQRQEKAVPVGERSRRVKEEHARNPK